MTTNIQSVGYIIQDKQGNAIFGAGATVDAAWAQVVDGVGTFFNAYGDEKSADDAYTEDFKTYGATAALLSKVEADGGAIEWDVVDGVACLPSEVE